MVNQAGSTLTETPLGGSTAHRSEGLLKEAAHVPPVAILIFSGSVFGREHKKLSRKDEPWVQGTRRIYKASPKTKWGGWVQRVGTKTFSHYGVTVVVMLGSCG